MSSVVRRLRRSNPAELDARVSELLAKTMRDQEADYWIDRALFSGFEAAELPKVFEGTPVIERLKERGIG
jgi:hypothetical protein